MATAPIPIGPAPVVPDASKAEADFDADYEAFMDWQKTVLTPGITALAINVHGNALAAAEDAATAQAAVGQAGLHATAAGTAAVAAADSAATALAAATSAASLIEKYLGPSATDPTTNKSGDPLTDGDWYINTVSGLQRGYTVAFGWKNGISFIAGVDSINGLQGSITSPTQAEAEAGAEATKPMTALRTAQAIAALSPPGIQPANQAQIESGTSNSVALTPLNIKWHPSSAKAWAIVTGGGTIVASYNISSVTKGSSPGRMKFSLSTPFSSANYSILASCASTYGADGGFCFVDMDTSAPYHQPNTSAFWIGCKRSTSGIDPSYYYISCYGDQ